MEGAIVGRENGVFVGLYVGIDGAEDGGTEGLEGSVVGREDGSIVGTYDGLADGTAVGSEDGV